MTVTAVLGTLRHAVRRWRVDKLPVAALIVTVTLTAALAAALPRVATRTADEALRSDAATADEAARTVFIASTRFQPDVPDAFLEEQVSHAAELLARAPGEVRAMTGPPAITVDARRYLVVRQCFTKGR